EPELGERVAVADGPQLPAGDPATGDVLPLGHARPLRPRVVRDVVVVDGVEGRVGGVAPTCDVEVAVDDSGGRAAETDEHVRLRCVGTSDRIELPRRRLG